MHACIGVNLKMHARIDKDARMHLMMRCMSQNETASQRVARQMRALLDRYKATPQDVQKRTGISYVTINRMMKAEAKTQPRPDKLRRIAEAYGETYESAFPSPADEQAITVEIGGQRFALKTQDGKPVNRAKLAEAIRKNPIELAEQIHALKQSRKKSE